jgi:BASS family bile acid:Na+ symporter
MTSTLLRLLAAAPRALTPLALAAAVLGIALPSSWLADRSDLLLAILVFATALGISAGKLAALRRRAWSLGALSLVPFVVLGATGWVLGRPFAAPVRDGLLAVGLSSAEVASVGLVALAGGDAAVAVGVVTASLVLSALLGPLAIGVLAGTAGHGGTAHLLIRFALVVLVPLVAGVAVRSSTRAAARLRVRDGEREGIAAITVAALVYGALSGTSGSRNLAPAIAASLLFLAASALIGGLWRRASRAQVAIAGAFTIGMRDFAVAAALASQAFGAPAGVVPGIYGVVMLLGGSIAASAFARGTNREGSSP